MAGEELTFLHANRFPDCAARVDKHFVDYFTLQFMSAGGLEIFYDAERYELTGPWAWAACPGPHIRFHAGAGHSCWQHRYCAFRGPLVARWQAAGLFPFQPPRPVAQPQEFAQKFDELLAELKAGGPWSEWRAVNLLESLLLDLAAADPTKREPPAWLRPILAELDESSELVPDFAELARRFGLGASTLRRRFRQVLGVSPHEYVVQRRLTRARRLLGETDLPLKSIAEELGYGDVYFFARQFKARCGVTPAAYRRSRQG